LMIDLLLDWWLTFSSTGDWPSPRLVIDLLLDWSCRDDIQIVIDFRLYHMESPFAIEKKWNVNIYTVFRNLYLCHTHTRTDFICLIKCNDM
jgi:hypothetical protein